MSPYAFRAAVALAAALTATACAPDEAPARGERPATLESRFPDAIGRFRAVGPTRPGVAESSGRRLVSAERGYDHEGREASLRIVDVSSEPSLVSSFGVARRLSVDELDVLTRAERVANEPALVQWTRDTGESEVQVLVAARYLVSMKVWPADRRDEARDLLPESVVEGLSRTR